VRPARFVVGCVALAAVGCKRAAPPPPPARLVEVRVIDRAPDVGIARTDALAARIAERFRARSGIEVALGAAPSPGVDWRLRVDIGVDAGEVDGKQVLRAIVAARMARVRGGAGESPVESRGIAEREVGKEEKVERKAAMGAHLERAVDDVIAGLIAKVKLHRAGSDGIVAALATGEAEVRGEAMRVAADRKEVAAVAALIALLKSEEPGERDRVVGVLVEIGDRRAVKPLIEAAKFRDVEELPKVIDALASLGGEEARAWLEFVASGHGDSGVRDLAKEALTRMDRPR